MRSTLLLLLSLSALVAFIGLDPEEVASRKAPVVLDPIPAGGPVELESLATRSADLVDQALLALLPAVREQSDPNAVRYAFRAYYNYRLTHPEKVQNPYFYYVDFGLDSRTARGYVFDMGSLEIVEGPFHVSHGRGSVTESSLLPLRFLNKQDSNATSLGLFRAEETYRFRGRSGGRAYSSIGLRLEGLSGVFNSAARARGIVVHGAPYVSSERAGLSEGCPAMEQQLADRLIPRIAEGGLVFHFSPHDPSWLRSDPWLLPGVPAGRV